MACLRFVVRSRAASRRNRRPRVALPRSHVLRRLCPANVYSTDIDLLTVDLALNSAHCNREWSPTVPDLSTKCATNSENVYI